MYKFHSCSPAYKCLCIISQKFTAWVLKPLEVFNKYEWIVSSKSKVIHIFQNWFLFHVLLSYDGSVIYSYFNGIILKIMGMPKIIVETTVTSDSSYQGKSLKSFLPCKWLENYLFYNFKHRDYFAVINCYSAFFLYHDIKMDISW